MLKVWIPGTTDVRDQGLGGTEWINDNVTVVNDGKLGKCLSFNGSNSRLSTTGFELSNKWSFAVWIKDIGNLNRWQLILMLNTNGSDNDTQMSFWIHDNYQADSGIPRFEICANGKYYSSVQYVPGQWNHFAGTYDESKLRFYLNGEKVYELSNTNAKLERHNLTIGARSTSSDGGHVGYSQAYNGLMNDLRIYDNEVLSPKIIKILSQGLICHYPLNRDGFGCDNLLLPPTSQSNYGSVSTPTTYTFHGWDIFGQYNLADDEIDWNDHIGEYLTYSCWLSNEEQTVGTGTGIMLHITYADNKYSQFFGGRNGIIGGTAFLTQGESDMLWITIQIPDPTTRSSPTTIKNIRASIRHNSNDGQSTVTCKLNKVEFGQTRTPWIPHSSDTLYSAMGLDSNIVYDTSGYQNNGELYTTDGTGEFIWESDTPKYNVSCHIHSLNSTTNAWAGTAYIRANCGLVEPEQLTIAFWCYARAEGYGGNTNQGVFCTTNNTGDATGSDYQTSAMNHRDTSVNINRITDASQLLLGMTFTADEWHHYAFTYDGQYARSYKDGALFDTKSFSGPVALNSFSSVILGLSRAGGVWRRNNNNYSDLRVYATCLSADDISALYNTSASLTSSGVLLSNEIQEV